jgi:biopolymer transport protein TolQ
VNQDLSILHLVLNASFVVQAVMLLLVVVSVASWAAIFRKLFALNTNLSATFGRAPR